jgi:hypothetical protein
MPKLMRVITAATLKRCNCRSEVVNGRMIRVYICPGEERRCRRRPSGDLLDRWPWPALFITLQQLGKSLPLPLSLSGLPTNRGRLMLYALAIPFSFASQDCHAKT